MHKISNLLNIQKIVTIHYQDLPQRYVSHEESHDFWEIIYADKDTVYADLGGKQTALLQGEMLFIKPNEPHFVESREKSPNIFIISFTCHSESMSFFANKKFPVPETHRSLLQIIMSEARETFVIPDFDPYLNELKYNEKPNLGGEQIIKNSLESLLIYLLRIANNQKSTQEFFVSKISTSTELQDEIVRILSGKIYGRFRLQELCTELHYGKTRLCTFFREKTGKSIYETYQKLKTDEAKKLIREGMPFTQIADKLCYDSVSSFNNSFKKQTGMTPGEYKESIKK
ncbi:MAG: helix-turn-helix domain-containing protein [Clostridia bacterium]|nr:helix-turn-helix domain-containing protein [Clostridia bacterium]